MKGKSKGLPHCLEMKWRLPLQHSRCRDGAGQEKREKFRSEGN